MSIATVVTNYASHTYSIGTKVYGEDLKEYFMSFATVNHGRGLMGSPIYIFAKPPLRVGEEVNFKDLKQIQSGQNYYLLPCFNRSSAPPDPLASWDGKGKKPYVPDVPKSPDEVMDQVRLSCGGTPRTRFTI